MKAVVFIMSSMLLHNMVSPRTVKPVVWMKAVVFIMSSMLLHNMVSPRTVKPGVWMKAVVFIMSSMLLHNMVSPRTVKPVVWMKAVVFIMSSMLVHSCSCGVAPMGPLLQSYFEEAAELWNTLWGLRSSLVRAVLTMCQP